MAIRSASLLVLLVLAALSPATTAARRFRLAPLARTALGPKPLGNRRNLTRATNKPGLNASAGARGAEELVRARAVEPEPVVGPVPVLVVEEVPVMQLVLTRDGREGVPPLEDSGLFVERKHGPPMGASDGISGSCKQEMMRFQKNKTRLERAQACEDKSNNTERALQALRHANVSAASSAAADTFRDCAGVSGGCAEQVAPKVVLALRLSGQAISQTCAEAVHKKPTQQAARGAESCQQNATRSMVRALAKRDMRGCLVAAEHGLRACRGVEPPCDFQLAPLLVAHVLEAAAAASAPQQVTEVLLAGMRAAEELTQEMMAEEAAAMEARGNVSAVNKTEVVHQPAASAQNASKAAAPVKTITKPTPPKKAVLVGGKDHSPAKPAANSTSPAKIVSAKGRKAISLIGVAARARVVPMRGPFRF